MPLCLKSARCRGWSKLKDHLKGYLKKNKKRYEHKICSKKPAGSSLKKKSVDFLEQFCLLTKKLKLIIYRNG